MHQCNDQMITRNLPNFPACKKEKIRNKPTASAAHSGSVNETRQETSSPRRSKKPIQNRSKSRGSKGCSPKQAQKKTGTDLPPRAQFLALDCEMVGVGQGGLKSAVACVTVIDWHGGLLFHSFIKQTEEVTDYRTYISGVTEKKLRAATMTLDECRFIVSQLLYNRVLVGHGLQNDLELLGITHPWWMIRDTAKYAPFMKIRHDGFLWPRKLKELTQEKLKRDIQVLGHPHSAYEDALAAFDLYKSVRVQWEGIIKGKLQKINSLHYPQIYNNYKLQMEREYIRLAREQQLYFNLNPTTRIVH